jgi:hypothetical protein
MSGGANKLALACMSGPGVSEPVNKAALVRVSEPASMLASARMSETSKMAVQGSLPARPGFGGFQHIVHWFKFVGDRGGTAKTRGQVQEERRLEQQQRMLAASGMAPAAGPIAPDQVMADFGSSPRLDPAAGGICRQGTSSRHQSVRVNPSYFQPTSSRRPATCRRPSGYCA